MSASEFHPSFTGSDTARAINPLVSKVGDFTPFYIAIAICSLILGFLLILNVVCCCSRYSDYWLDRHTGNRWIVSIWSATPHKQPPLDYTELEDPQHIQYAYPYRPASPSLKYEAEIVQSVSQQPLTPYHDLYKKESDI